MPQLSPQIWIVLGLLGYLLITCVLAVAAGRVRNVRERHDLIVAARKRRQEYLLSQTAAANVDVEEG